MQHRFFLKALAIPLVAVILWFAFKPNPHPVLMGWDKMDHMAAFFVLAAYGRIAWAESNRIAVFLVLVAFGGAIEIVQGMTGRDAQWGDWIADIIAAVAGMVAGGIVLRIGALLQPPRTQG